MRIFPTTISAFVVLVFLSSSTCLATSYTWDGSENTDWFNTNNWDQNAVPGNDDEVIVNASASTNVMLTNSTANLTSLTITNQTLVFSNWNTALIASNVTIESGGNLTHAECNTNTVSSNTNRVYIICTNFSIEAGGTINVNEKGYDLRQGPGAGSGSGTSGGGGGGYGGKGGACKREAAYGGGAPYGATNAPVSPGSGGGGSVGASGGGVVRIQADGTVTIRGTITADGEKATVYEMGGGGSGGAIYITCNTFGGSTNGVLRANGGNGYGNTAGGGGGGGRIAVDYTSLGSPRGVRFSTLPGSGYADGDWSNRWWLAAEMGTVYLPNTNLLSGTLTDNLFSNVILVVSGFTSWALNSLTVSNCWLTFGERGFQLTVTNDLRIENGTLGVRANSTLDCGGNIIVGSGGKLIVGENSQGTNCLLNCGGNLILTNGGSLYVYSSMTNGTGNGYGALVSVTGGVSIYSNSWIYPHVHETNGGSVLFRMRNLTIATNGGFFADVRGYAVNLGPGHGTLHGNGAGGAGYGGKGGDGGAPVAGGPTYGFTNAPTAPGSGGSQNSGGNSSIRGGGSVRIEAGGAVTMDGVVTANGGYGGGNYGGGGSGGGIFLRSVGTFQGGSSSILRANGGNGYSTAGGGGGGGRIAVWYKVSEQNQARLLSGDYSKASITNEYSGFSGTISVTNGTGCTGNPAESGTKIFLTVPPSRGTMFIAH